MRIRSLLIVALFLSSLAVAQDQIKSLPDGVKLPVSLIGELRLQQLAVGDEIRFLVKANLRGPGNVVAVPKGAIVIAHVREMQLAAKDKQAKLYLVFDEAKWKGGNMPLHAYIVPPVPYMESQYVKSMTQQMNHQEIISVGIEPHVTAGTVLYAKQNLYFQERADFWIQQLSEPGPSAPPANIKQ